MAAEEFEEFDEYRKEPPDYKDGIWAVVSAAVAGLLVLHARCRLMPKWRKHRVYIPRRQLDGDSDGDGDGDGDRNSERLVQAFKDYTAVFPPPDDGWASVKDFAAFVSRWAAHVEEKEEAAKPEPAEEG